MVLVLLSSSLTWRFVLPVNVQMYYIKARTDVRDWPWIFVKIHEPPTAYGATGVHFVSMKKMKEEYKVSQFWFVCFGGGGILST